MRSARPKFHGFTLIELLCTMAIGTVILLAAASVLGSSGDGYERVTANVAAEREARALITQLSSDMASALFHKNGVTQASNHSWPRDQLGFLSIQPAHAQSESERIGDLCAVHYYLDDLDHGGQKVRCLMRGFRNSRETFNALKEDTIASLFTPRPAIDEPIAFGVVSFEARPKTRDSQGRWIDWVRNDLKAPDAHDVRIVLACRDLSRRLITASDWDGSSHLGSPAMAAQHPNLEVFATRIRFGNHASF